jgi:hypothetical protein
MHGRDSPTARYFASPRRGVVDTPSGPAEGGFDDDPREGDAGRPRVWYAPRLTDFARLTMRAAFARRDGTPFFAGGGTPTAFA